MINCADPDQLAWYATISKFLSSNSNEIYMQTWQHFSYQCIMEMVYHYENMPIQIYRKFHRQIFENFQIKKS